MPSGAVTVGGLVINMAADTAQLKSDMAEGARVVDTGAKTMINSMTGVTESSDRATDAGARMVRQLKEEIATFGMTSEQLTQYKANLNGVGGEVESLMGRLNQMKAAQAGFTDQLAASEAQATQRIRDMVAASMAEVSALNDVAAATQGVTSAQAAAASTGRTLAETQRLQALNMQGVAASMKSMQEGTVAMSNDAQRILAQYDPLGAKLRSLQSDMAVLRKEMGNSVDPAAIKAFQGLEDEIAKTQALMARAAAQANALGMATSQLTQTQTTLIDRFRDQAATIGMSRSQLMAYQAAQAGVTEQTKDAIAKVKAHEDAIKAATKAKEEERTATMMIGQAFGVLAAAYAALKIGEYVKEAAMLAARYETLDVVMGVVGRTAGYTKIQMEAAAESVAKQGITLTESRNSVIKLVQAHIDLSNATALARIAQDAAVIGNINSSEAFDRLVNGVARGNVLILRNIGINVNLQAAYQQMAATLGKSTTELTENERVQARLNAVLERGKDIAGTYEAAMDTASKQITSMQRYTEDLKTTFGQVFNETLTIGVMALTDGLRDANGAVSDLARNGQLVEWGRELTSLFVTIANTVGNAYTSFQKMDAFARHLDARKAINADADAQSKAVSDYGNGMAEKGAVEKIRRIESVRQAALAQENADYVAQQAALSGNFDRFQRAADERMAARQAKQKADAAERLKVDQDYTARATALLIANANKSVEVQQAAQAKLAKEVYQGTPTYRDSEGREPKAKVDQADNTRMQDHLQRIRDAAGEEKALTEQQMKLDDMRHKAGEISDAAYYGARRENITVLARIEDQMYEDELTALRSHHNSTQAETAKNEKAINDIIAKQAKARTAAGFAQDTDDEEARLREKALYDDIVKATLNAGATNIKGLDDQIAKQREHNAEIGKTKEQIELAKQAQVDAAAKQMQSDADYLRDGLAKWGLDEKSEAVIRIRLNNLDSEIDKRRTLAGLFAVGADAEAAAKASADLDKYLDPTKAEKFGGALKGSLGSAAKSMIDLTNAMERYGAKQAANDKARADAQVLLKGNDEQRAKGLEDLEKVNRKGTREQLAGYGDMAAAAASFFGEHSRGYQALTTVSQVFHAAELAMTTAELVPKAISAVLSQGQGDPYTAFGRMAAMAALVAGLGVAIGGAGGSGPSVSQQRQASQGTGTVLGDGSAKSDSIANAVKLTAANSSTQINYLASMNTALQTIQANIKNFAAQLLQTTDVTNPNVGALSAGGLGSGLNTVAMAAGGYALGASVTLVGDLLGPVGMVVGALASKIPAISNLVGKISNGIFGGKQSVEDSGLTMDKTSLAAIMSGGLNAKTFADVKTDGGWFRGDKHDTKTSSVGAEANRQFATIITSMADAVKQAGVLLGMNGDAFSAKLNTFVVDIGKVSLKDLKGDDLQKALEAVFSKLGDQMASFGVAGLQQFQQVGEGYLETLVRVASDYAKVDASLQSIGKTFGSVGVQSIAARESLISLLGGIDDFQSKTADYGKNFLTTAQQLAPVQKYVTDSLAQMGLGWVTTRQQFAGVVAGLDLTTTAGQQTYAALMNLEAAFAATHEAIVDTTKSAQDIADERKDLQSQLDQLMMTSAQLLAKQRDALDDSNKALFDQVQAAQKVKDAQDAAKTSLGNFLTQMKSFAATTAGLNNSLALGSLTTLTPEQQYAEARRQFEETRQKAAAGDATAQGSLQSIEQTFLQLSQKLNGGDAQYSSDLAAVMHANDDLAKWAAQQVDVAQASLNALTSSSATLTDISATLKVIAQGGQLPAATSAQVATSSVSASAPINYSALGADNTTSLVTEIKALRVSNEAMAAELKGLRADQQKQTGDVLKTVATSADNAADKVVAGKSQADTDIEWKLKAAVRKIV